MEVLPDFTFAGLPLKVHYGNNIVAKLGEVVAGVGGSRAVVITGKSIATKTDLVARVQEALGSSFAGCFDRVSAHVLESNVAEGLAFLRETGGDVLVSLGGGSPENAAEAIAMLAAEGGRLEDHQVHFEPPNRLRAPELRQPKLPIVAIPTTLSGAEIATGFSVTQESPRRKLLFRDPLTRPAVVLLDPTVAIHTPLDFFASTGLNAVDHCVEGVYSKARTPVSDALYLHAARELFEWLPRLVGRADDVEVRGRLQVGAFLAGLAHLYCRPALNHAISHHLGGTLDVPHGLAHGIPLPHTMRFNLDVAADRLATLAETLGLSARGAEPTEAAGRAIDAVADLIETLRLPARLRDVGVKEADLPQVAEDTMRDYVLSYNPKPATSADVLSILQAAW
ncbi:MAG: iron-containing alcohol dehydrogenase [Chloroflexi bacterium]|nr:iron-containing alcohol dehydrogenase [Chloroflexota bacterium]